MIEICGQKIDLNNLESVYLNCDCMQGMREFPDKYFDLAIVDPPYGIGQDWKKRNKGKNFQDTTYKNGEIPSREYFSELFRVSKHQVIWGYNYYVNILGPTNYLIIWDKKSSENQVLHYSKAEIAYTDIHIPCNIVSIQWDGYKMGKETGNSKIHPHQKPIELYEWILNRYAKDGDIILDTHVGSASSLIACHNTNHKYVGFELDKHYYELSKKRLEQETAQMNIYDFMGGET